MFNLNKIINFKDEQDDYNDYFEKDIFNHVNEIESTINSFGYHNTIAHVDLDLPLIKLKKIIKDFFNKRNINLNYLELVSKCTDKTNCNIYTFCYEPYGDEMFYIYQTKDDIKFINC